MPYMLAKMFLMPLIAMLCIPPIVRGDQVQTIKHINQLSAKLMDGYNKNTLPSGDFRKKFEVEIQATLVALGDIDEIEERLSTVMNFVFMWTDVSMQWNTSDHIDITNITMSWRDVWKPVLMVINPHEDATKTHSDSTTTVGYDNEGGAYLLQTVTLETTCDLDTTYFPFDSQTCPINLYISGNDAYYIRVEANWRDKKNSYKENGAWTLIWSDIKGSEDSRMTIAFKFKRKPLFMLVNILLPIIVLALLTPMVFLMPKNSGERVGYAITTLLAISVYMMIISDHLPKNSDPMPLVSIMIFVWYVLNSSIVFLVIVNTKINHIKDGRPVPMIAQKFVILTRRMKGRRRLHTSGTPEEETSSCLETTKDSEDGENAEINGNAKQRSEREGPFDHSRYPARVTWQELSVAIDRWGFALSYIIKITIPLLFFTILKVHSD